MECRPTGSPSLRSTLDLSDLLMSEPRLTEVEARPNLRFIALPFDEARRLRTFTPSGTIT
jgi:hypothetical protein